jgi:hypothetical protein
LEKSFESARYPRGIMDEVLERVIASWNAILDEDNL